MSVKASENVVRFLLDGELVTVSDPPPTMTVLEYLRNVAGRSGAKEGCAEGDCGACTVAIGALSPDGTKVRYRTINSCIRFLATIDGQELVTVESLQGDDGSLHPVQRAMVDLHASQCGFCTPGFVMSLFGLYLDKPAPSRSDVVEALAGNLCRCTGYRPIIAAGLAMTNYPEPQRWSRSDAASSARASAVGALQRGTALELAGFLAPTTEDDLAAAFERAPHATLLAGGTDVGLWVTKQLRVLPMIISLGRVEELGRIETDAERIVIGAGVALSDAWETLVGCYPQLLELAARFGSPPVRNSGTLCGNLANGSPIGDAIPILIAIGAEVELRCGAHRRRLPLEALYLGYQRKDLSPGEFLTRVVIPRPQPGEWIASYKVAKRIDQDISAVCAAIAVRIDAGHVESVRIAFGGMAAIPARALSAEDALRGAPWNESAIERAIEAMRHEFEPLTDMRATDAYRLAVAGNLLRRFYLEHSSSVAALRIDDPFPFTPQP